MILVRISASSWQAKKERVVENHGEVVMIRPTKSLYHFCLEASHMVTLSHMGCRKRNILDMMKRIIILKIMTIIIIIAIGF